VSPRASTPAPRPRDPAPARRPGRGKLAVLGTGKLGESLVRGLIDAGVVVAQDVTVTAAHAERIEQLRRSLGVAGTLSNAEAVKGARIVLLAVKPQTVPAVLRELRDALMPHQLLISVAASASDSMMM